ncbi:TPA: LysR family transcriptional regulator [Vibrio vulnificus]|uniref:LysR family transcriptional regulator n=1 Tax=Vibrio parahaemolyticus TaxID=670 RepID=UPI00111EC4AE|nr:LysR family transcriptional regulator [Vibrio parahaemolyticus]HAS6038012.1 LysR family transcriptional regulator [Vibrio vulnificus]MDF4269861.1 LysR family transcriptional regulator [Vibrio parahaemolyticus]MDF4275187.1 LysR family transcriptional regulator [Vibrio parahaemolyticus]MDF4299789.1 LysR family transcriptional regulator [Vibrio parahaemolyticus]MUT55280.1 LysR family transcriptional regulator [Vibrio parahaemolyticus]
MELRQIKYFLAVANSGGVTKAADILNVTQPAISRQIRELEEELGVQLFERVSRKLILTVAGEHFREQMDKVTSDIEKATQTVKKVASGAIGNLRLGSVETVLWEGLVPNHLSLFRTQNPDVRIEMITDNTTVLLNQMEHGSLDCAFVYLFRELDSSYGVIQLRSDPMALAYPASWEKKFHDNVSISKLNSLPFIRFPQESYPAFFEWQEQQFRTLGLSPNVLHWAHHESSMLALVAAEQGIAIVNSKHINRASPLVRFITLSELDLQLPLCFVWKNEKTSPVVKRLSNQLVDS